MHARVQKGTGGCGVYVTGLGANQGWPEPYIHRYTRCTYGIFSRKSPYIRSYTVQIYGSGQPLCQSVPLTRSACLAGVLACRNGYASSRRC